jgi:hypothetical protein
MTAFLKINRPDSVITVALHDYVVKWDHGRLLGGGTVFAAPGLNYFQLDLRHWEVVPGDDDNFECHLRKDKNILLVIKDGERVTSDEAFGCEEFMQENQKAYAVFLKSGNTSILSSSEYDVGFQPIRDRSRGQNVTAIIAVRKVS